MNAIEIRHLSKSFRGMYAVNDLNMTVPQGSIYGFIGENGSGKSTTEKLICGHLVPDGGEIKLFGKDYKDAGVRMRVGALIENTGCFPSSSVYQNLMMQAINLGVPDRDAEIQRVLKIVRMEDSANVKFKSCSLGMKQRAHRHSNGAFRKPRAFDFGRADQRTRCRRLSYYARNPRGYYENLRLHRADFLAYPRRT